MRSMLAALVVALLPLASLASVHIEELTTVEVGEAVAAGKTVAIVPIGGTEQNGPHLAIGKHNVRVRILAARIAEGLGNALVAPVLAYVPEGRVAPPEGHMRYAGTISIPEDAFEKVLEGTARSLRQHGFRHVVFLGDHGGYLANVRAVVKRMNASPRKDGFRVHFIPEYYRELEHAGAEDTSLALALDPLLVRADRVPEKGAHGGVQGDPRQARLDTGRKLAEEIVARTVEAIRKAVAPAPAAGDAAARKTPRKDAAKEPPPPRKEAPRERKEGRKPPPPR